MATKRTGRKRGGQKFPNVIWDELLRRIGNGELLIDICKESHFPHINTVLRRVRVDQPFAHAYQMARQTQAHVLAEQTVKIADETRDPNNVAGVSKA
jgi:hypothetical protein